MYQPQLNKISVAAPCTADWYQMYGNERVRFCGQCQLYVYNLSAMTREQTEQLILRNEGRLCVRFYQRKDGTILTQNCPNGLAAVKAKFNRVRASIASALLTFFGSLGLLWFVKPAPLNIVMGGFTPTESVVPLAPVVGEVPRMGQMMQLVTRRSEPFIRERAIHKSTPVFPVTARSAAGDSQVVVEITISPEGKVIIAECINGNPALQRIAVETARQWQFRPMKADGLPVTVKSQLTFRLAP
jgi:TonB family protein